MVGGVYDWEDMGDAERFNRIVILSRVWQVFNLIFGYRFEPLYIGSRGLATKGLLLARNASHATRSRFK